MQIMSDGSRRPSSPKPYICKKQPPNKRLRESRGRTTTTPSNNINNKQYIATSNTATTSNHEFSPL